jgi:hypothetical protein
MGQGPSPEQGWVRCGTCSRSTASGESAFEPRRSSTHSFNVVAVVSRGTRDSASSPTTTTLFDHAPVAPTTAPSQRCTRCPDGTPLSAVCSTTPSSSTNRLRASAASR